MGVSLTAFGSSASAGPYFDCNWAGMTAIGMEMLAQGAFDDQVLDPPDYLKDPEGLVRPGPTGRIPVYKLASNDGWIVTKEECVQIVESASWWPRTKELPAWLWHKWLEFVTAAADGGGFSVW